MKLLNFIVLCVLVFHYSFSEASTCNWNNPGADPYRGDIAAAVDDYTDMPSDVRAALKEKIKNYSYDDIAIIKRDSIQGNQSYSPDLRGMHFGHGVCNSVDRSKWDDTFSEIGLVYCEKEFCVIIPTVCNNVSILKRLPIKIVQRLPEEKIPFLDNTPIPETLKESVVSAPLYIGDYYGSSPSVQIPNQLVYYPSYVYTDTSGQKVSVQAVPEPSTYILLFGGLVLMGVWTQYKHRKLV